MAAGTREATTVSSNMAIGRGSRSRLCPGYDANGSVIEKLTWDTSGTEAVLIEDVHYEYNLQNRLVKVTTTADGSTTVTEYKYDPDGNRVQKTVDGTVTDYLIDAYNHTGYAQVFKETTGSDSTVYIIGDDILGQAKGADENAPKYLLYDGHGSARQLVKNTGATVLNDYSYDAYGVMLGGNPGSASNPDAPATNLLYAGEQFDIDAQQYYIRARYYDPLNGRFNRADPFAGNHSDP
jgi:RHS repeat-associated protein